MRRVAWVAVLFLVAACTSGGGNGESSATPTGPRTLTGAIGAAAYSIEVPAAWNGTLFLYSHGYVAPGGSNPAIAAPGADATNWLVDHGYAIAGSAYGSTGWALEDAFKDQIALLDFFNAQVGKPKRVIAWGHSLGGIVTAGLVQLHPDRFAAAMPMCGVLAGDVGSWNAELDSAYAFRTLLAPTAGLQLVHITDPTANLQRAMDAFGRAAATPAGRARLALIGALTDLPGWFDPRQPEPAATDFTAQAAAQASWESRVDFSFAFKYRAELEQRAGGNPSWNTGVDYRHLLSISSDRAEVTALYAAAGMNLDADLRTLNAGMRIQADPQAAAYLERYITFNGHLSIPVLSMHTTGDGLVIVPSEAAYASVVKSAGDLGQLRQVFVRRAGHCTFTEAETIAALEVLLKRLDSGSWDAAALQPAALNAQALAQGAATNAFFGFPAAPAFVSFSPAPFPRPFAMGAAIGA
jgi:pimeloyl-ACP methyl ester carboxylesterase